MKSLILGLIVASFSFHALADTNNVSQACVYNATNNKGNSPGNHWVRAQLSWPGLQVPWNHWGPVADYDQWSCVSTSVLEDQQSVHVFSAGQGQWGAYFTDCGKIIYHEPSTVLKNTTSYFVSTQVSSSAGQTQCKFIKNAPTGHFPRIIN